MVNGAKPSLCGNNFFQPPCALALLLCAWRLFRVRGCGGVERCTTWSRKKEATAPSVKEASVASLVVISKQVGRCVAAFRASQFREKVVYK